MGNLARKLERWRQGQTRLLIYGAGMHTRDLFERLDFSGLSLVAIADKNPALGGARLAGTRIVPPDRIPGIGAQAILISSLFYEQEIERELRALVDPDVEIVGIYGAS